MDGQMFDDIVRHLAASQSRRQTIRALAGSALAAALGPFGLGQVAAQEIAACRERLALCDEATDCCEERNVACRRLSRRCRERTGLRRERCCGVRDARCADNCDCCRGFRCRDNRCR